MLSLIQITDCHLLDRTDDLFHGLNTQKSFQDTIEHALQKHPGANCILITGDVSQTGNQKSYELFQSVISHYKIPVYCIPGNHDNPITLQKFIPLSPVNELRVIKYDLVNIILLNSVIAGKNCGEITDDMLGQLDKFLEKNHNRKNIIAIHHPPLITHSKWLDDLGLMNRNQLVRILNHHKNPITVLCGHIHQDICHKIKNVCILTTPSTCFQFVENSSAMQRYDAPNPAYRYLELKDNGTIKTDVHFLSDYR